MPCGNLAEQVLYNKPVKNIWPTVTVQDSENNGGLSQYDRNTIPLNAAVKNKGEDLLLNPAWVEWLMIWPYGWTDPKPLKKIVWPDPSIDPANTDEIKRTTKIKRGRRARIRMLGNGQVPVQAATALLILLGYDLTSYFKNSIKPYVAI